MSSNDETTMAITKGLEPYCKAYCSEPARLDVETTDAYIHGTLFLSSADHAVIDQGELGDHLKECFDEICKHLGGERQRFGLAIAEKA